MPALAAACRALLDLALPPCCVLCGEPLPSAVGLVCRACWGRVVPLPSLQCGRCGHPREDHAVPCRWCPQLPSFVQHCRSWCWVSEGTGGDLVHALKYGGWSRLGEAMGGRMAALRGARPPHGHVLVIPVPLSLSRRRERGYNQAECLGRVVARHWHGRLVSDAVVRGRETGTQVRLTPAERSANVQGAFAVGPRVGTIHGAHVVLVDDVITTAATLTACATVLADHGAASICFVTFGRARAAWDRMTPSWSSSP
jgi:ComF family protein